MARRLSKRTAFVREKVQINQVKFLAGPSEQEEQKRRVTQVVKGVRLRIEGSSPR